MLDLSSSARDSTCATPVVETQILNRWTLGDHFKMSRSPTKDMKTRCRNSTIYTESWQKKAAAPELDLCFQDVLSIDSCPSVHVQEGIRSLDVGVTNTFQHVGKFKNTEFSKQLRLNCPRETRETVCQQ